MSLAGLDGALYYCGWRRMRFCFHLSGGLTIGRVQKKPAEWSARAESLRLLAPSGYVQVGGELWQAEVMEDVGPIEKGESVKVQEIRGLILIVGRKTMENMSKEIIRGVLIQQKGKAFLLGLDGEHHLKTDYIWPGHVLHWLGKPVCARYLPQRDYERGEPIVLIWPDVQAGDTDYVDLYYNERAHALSRVGIRT